MRLQDNLVLFDYLTTLLGGNYEEWAVSLRNVDPGLSTSGQSNYFSTFEQRRSQLNIIPGQAQQSFDRLREFDLNILEHQTALAQNRPGFQLTYFQYLAALYTELYLYHFATEPARLFLALNDHRAQKFSYIPPFQAADLRKLAFWMATGAGKTLLMHLNLLQFFHYRPFRVDNIILLTPGETLSRQHLQELYLSGFTHAEYALQLRGRQQIDTVQVLEITKLYVPGKQSSPRSGVSLPTSRFPGCNLLLVDEGHKGTATQTDTLTERAWRDIRQSLVENNGFTFEYSATFAQVTENDDALRNEYARSIVYEYAYGRFHADGYGKEFAVANLKNEDDLYGDTLLLAALLTFYEQHKLYRSTPDAGSVFNLALPLMVFVGAQVTAGPDVLQVVQFFNRVLSEPQWAIAKITAFLQGHSGLPGPDDLDLFANAFPYLKSLTQGWSQQGLYEDLCRRLFGGTGPVQLHLLRQADGEIGLRTSDSRQEAYFGVVNVGDAAGFLRKVERETKLIVSVDDHLTPSLFAAIDQPDAVNFLVGSKKFLEGWSSWRVSVMGLLRIGKNAGAQVLQLFGRGVRLKGYQMSLRRSAGLRHPPQLPPHLPLLETLHVFGLKANYLEIFLKTLDREGVKPFEMRLLPLSLDPELEQKGLATLEMNPEYDFQATEVVSFSLPLESEIKVNLTPQMVIGGEGTGEAERVGQSFTPGLLLEETLDKLDYEGLFYHALAVKQRNGWHNFYISRSSIREFFKQNFKLAGPGELLVPKTPAQLSSLNRVAQAALEKGLKHCYYQHQRRAETRQLQRGELKTTHPNFPTVTITQPDGTLQTTPAYQLSIPPDLLAEVEQIIQDAQRLRQDSLQDALPRLYFDTYLHLYIPLLLQDRAEILASGMVVFKQTKQKTTSTPTGLEKNEAQFIVDLRDFWKINADDWQEYELFVLRNLPKKGIGFFKTAGFYPDFLLWLKRDDQQVLAFVDPKGLTHGSWEKVSLLQEDIRNPALAKQVGFPILGYIVTPTPLAQIPIPPDGDIPPTMDSIQWLQSQSVYEQDVNKKYIRAILAEMKSRI